MTGHQTKAPDHAEVDRAAAKLPPEGRELRPQHRTTLIVVSIGFILIAGAVPLHGHAAAGRGRDGRSSLGFSFNSFFQWLGNLGPLVQIPIILLVFGAVVGLLLLLIEYAPRAGTRATSGCDWSPAS